MINELTKILELKRTELNFCMKSDYVKGQVDLIEELIKILRGKDKIKG